MMSLGLEATELRLGLPGSDDDDHHHYHHVVDLKLKLPTVGMEEVVVVKVEDVKVIKRSSDHHHGIKPSPAKAQVVGWPPVRSFRRNIMATNQSDEKAKKEEVDHDKKSIINNNNYNNAAFVKVSMDGAPYLRKVDLKVYTSYHNLSLALEKMFSSFTCGNCDSQGINFMNENKLMDLLNGSKYVPTYEDKDGDWMLVGDVPWEMFVDSCKRLRIMKGSEATGIAPKTMEKCKIRS